MRVEKKKWGRCYWFKWFRVYVFSTNYSSVWERISIRWNP